MKHEFKVTKSKDQTVYTLESASGGGTSSGSIASVSTALGGVQRRPTDTIFAQEEKKEAPKPRNFVAKNAKMGGAGKMKDKAKVIPRKEKHKKPLAESYAEDLAKQVFNANPNIKDENAVLDAAWPIVVKDLGNKRAMSMFNYDEDFPSDLVSVYSWLQKDQQGVAEDDAGDVEQRFAAKMEKEKQRLAKLKQTDPEAYKREMAKSKTSGRVPPVSTFEDHEIQMASSELQSIAKNAVHLLDLVRKYSEEEGLDAWQQSKITKAADYLNSVLQSVSGEQTNVEGVGIPFRGVGGAFNRGDDEHHHLDTPNNYAVAIDGKTWKVFSDQRQAQNIARSLQSKGKNAKVHLTGASPTESVAEEWSQKYKSSINCSHPKGFSQKAHCAGKKKHNESMEMESVCPDCGMCEAHGNSKIYDKCWPGHRKVPGKARGEKGSCKKIGEDSYMMELAGQLAEKIPQGADVDYYIKDFAKSTAPQFKGKSPAKRKQMAIAAYYGSKQKKK